LAAINAPLSRESVQKSLTKFGGTPYEVTDFTLQLDEGLMLPISKLNELRRAALQALTEKSSHSENTKIEKIKLSPALPQNKRATFRSARFASAEQIPDLALSYFDRIYLPLHKHKAGIAGVILPPVIFEREMPTVEQQLTLAKQNGATHALVGNLGHLPAVRRAGLIPVGDYRLNVTNNESLHQLESLAFYEILLSPELTLPQIRDLGGNSSVIVYGRTPLMTLEKCVIKEISDCNTCNADRAILTDRRGITFPVLREWEHRNVVYNSLPTCMSDKEDLLLRNKISNRHFLFSTESKSEAERVISAYQTHSPLQGNVRRLK
jgi:putative protease